MEENKLIIHLTDARPIKINKNDWPILASCQISGHDGHIESQATSKWDSSIAVRQHLDGRTIVYGKYELSSKMHSEKNYEFKCGELITPSDEEMDSLIAGDIWVGKEIIRSIRSVEALVVSKITIARHDRHIAIVMECADDCINNIPALELK